MTGGTYARALQVGFNEKQAAFFAHLGIDTRAEAVCEVKELLEKKQVEIYTKEDMVLLGILVGFVSLAIGVTIGAIVL